MISMILKFLLCTAILTVHGHQSIPSTTLSSTFPMNFMKRNVGSNPRVNIYGADDVSAINQNSQRLPLQYHIFQYYNNFLEKTKNRLARIYSYLHTSGVGISYLIRNILFGSSVTPNPSSLTGQIIVPTHSVDKISWVGTPSSTDERDKILIIRSMALSNAQVDDLSYWGELSDVEILRFLRDQGHNLDATWQKLSAHIKWRASINSPSKITVRSELRRDLLQQEVFWLGVNAQNCATLVLRSQLHDGENFNEDPRLFESFVVDLLEQGRILYGVGTVRQVCVLIDRGGTVSINSAPKKAVRDFPHLPNTIALVAQLGATVQSHYPDVLHSVIVVPSSWFFAMCYRMIRGVLDTATKEKIKFIMEEDIPFKLHPYFARSTLPAHLGGSSMVYKSHVDVVTD